MFLIYLSKNILLFALEIFKNKFFAKLHNKLSVKLYMRFINLDFQIYSRISSASLLNNINSEIEKIFQETMDALYTIYSEIIIILSLLIFLLFFDPTVTIMTLAVFSISGISFKIILGNKHKFWGKKRRLSLEQIIFTVQKTYNSFREIKFIKNQEQFTKKFNNDMHNYTNSLAILKIIQASPRLLFEIIIIFIISLLIFFLIFLNLSNKELLVTVSVFAAATIRSAPSLNRVIVNYTTIAYFKTSINAVLEIFKLYKTKKIKNKNLKKLDKLDTITFKNVSYKHFLNKKNIFFIKNLELKKNHVYAMVGTNGSGKTTFLDLLSGLLNLQNGTLKFNNIDLKKIDFVNSISYCPQYTYLNDEAVLQTIIEDNQFTKDKFDNLSKISGLNEILKKNKNFLKLKVKSNGKNLSGGQKHIISIMKTLYQDRDLMIFDEPTSNLSKHLSESFVKSLQKIKHNKIIVVTTHDITLLKFFDEVIDMKNYKG